MQELASPKVVYETIDPEREDLQAKRISEFLAVLPGTAIASLDVAVDICSENPVSDVSREFMLERSLGMRTLYAPSEIATDLQNHMLGFEPITSKSKASRNGVFFGAFHLDDGSEMRVAVKPLAPVDGSSMSKVVAEKECLKDYFMNVVATEANFDCLQPFGMLIDQEGTCYSLTVLDEELDTFDSIDWSVFYDPKHETTGMMQLWSKVASLVAMLHSTGESFHGDLAPRNISNNPSGQVALLDWEAGSISTKPSVDLEERFGKSWLDLKSLMVSLARPNTMKYNPGAGLFKYCETSWWEAFEDVFFTEYCDWRMALAEQGSHHMKAVHYTTEELTQLRAVLSGQMEDLEARFRQRDIVKLS